MSTYFITINNKTSEGDVKNGLINAFIDQSVDSVAAALPYDCEFSTLCAIGRGFLIPRLFQTRFTLYASGLTKNLLDLLPGRLDRSTWSDLPSFPVSSAP